MTNNEDGKFSRIRIPKYSYIDTNKHDKYGKKIVYSLVESVDVSSDKRCDILCYNGKWKMYSTVFTSNGEEY